MSAFNTDFILLHSSQSPLRTWEIFSVVHGAFGWVFFFFKDNVELLKNNKIFII